MASVDVRYLHEYARGVGKQFSMFLNGSRFAAWPCVSQMEMFASAYRTFVAESVLNEPSLYMVAEYCNFLLQTHIRLSEAFKWIGHFESAATEVAKTNLAEKITRLVYEVLVDVIALECIELIGGDKWKEVFNAAFKEFRAFLKSKSSHQAASASNATTTMRFVHVTVSSREENN